ncbi:type IV secretory system conjugative DNA transfer family protein [Maridesulfovibrio salexigens]|uniref:TRAG family protein n=1 Tax=Maridesulfovibrio salexigens (strain ATCC 14822 / DSM 2638 / NCIMB 8403 / VKM B-1763) TaxID=526222 RepID=C6BT46_MARSD|nr:type IV secretory system conjugative DNA transfer family protein [Maridesulfovibrio salexigens]ACS79750.1 TRAG family protein [Maridesulfovibrio salexigens DSM 2638]
MTNNVYGLGKKKGRGWSGLLYLLFLLVLACVAMGYATQNTAVLYGHHKALGPTAYEQFYWPWMIFNWVKIVQPSEYLDRIISTSLIIFVAPQILVLGLVALFSGKPKGVDDIHGTAHWAEKKEIKKAGLLEGSGVYVGGWQDKKVLRYLRHNGPEHIMAFAPTRSGKGVGLVLPTLLSWEGSTIVLDIKGENWALTSGWRKAQGHKVMKFDPTDTTGSSARYNPLSEIRLGGPHAIPDAQNIASMIVDPDGKGLRDYWNKAAFSFLGGTILHCLIYFRINAGTHATLNDLSLMLADENREMSELFEEMLNEDHVAQLEELFGEEMDHDSKVAIRKFIAAAAREMLNKADAELSGVVSTAVANMALYRDPVVSRSTSGCDFRITDLMNSEQPVSLYLVIRPSDIDRLRPLVRLILNIVLRRLTEEMEFSNGAVKAGYKHRLLLMLDEFTSLGKMEIFERALAFMAGYGIKAYIIVQDLTQLQSAYGKEESIMSNCHLRMAYAPNKIETAQVLSKMTGEATVVQRKTSISGTRAGRLSRANVSVSEAKRALLTPDECMRLPGAEKDHNGMITKSGDMLIFPAGFAPIYGKQILFFLDPKFLERSKIPAPDKSDKLNEQIEETPAPNEPAIDLDAEMEELEEGTVYEDEEY